MSRHGFIKNINEVSEELHSIDALLSSIVQENASAKQRAPSGWAFSKHERKSLFATCVYCIAYGARCTHFLEPFKKAIEDKWLSKA